MSAARQAAGAISTATQWFVDPDGLTLESGERLASLQIAYRTWGTLNATGDNAVLICHALTGSADADDWWPGLIGDGRALDPRTDFIVCSNVIGGCYGSSGPYLPAADGRRAGLGFPAVSVRDMVAAQRRLIAHLNINRLQLVIGPSLGGMQVLEWAASFPDLVERIAPIGVSAKHSAWCIGIGEAQRAAIQADPDWQSGRYADHAPPRQGLAAARMMAMVTYRSWQNFESRFGRNDDQRTDFDVVSYLRYQGDKLVDRFDAASYFRLTEAMDSHDVGRDRGGTAAVLEAIQQPSLVVAVRSDVLYPPIEQEYLAGALPQAVLRYLDSDHGHDGFLIALEPLAEMITAFRSS